MVAHTNRAQRNRYLDKFSKGEVFICRCCTKTIYRNVEPKAIVEHIDNNSENNHFSNHQIYCRSCNIRKNPKQHKPKKVTTQSEKTNQRAEPAWRNWILNHAATSGEDGYSVNDAIFAGAELFDISPETIERRYLPKITSSSGKLLEHEGKLFVRDLESIKKKILNPWPLKDVERMLKENKPQA